MAWPYLSQDQKESFKQQAREILRQLHTIKPADGWRPRCHVVADPNIFTNGRIGPLERDIIFSDIGIDSDTLKDIMWWNDLYDDGFPGL